MKNDGSATNANSFIGRLGNSSVVLVAVMLVALAAAPAAAQSFKATVVGQVTDANGAVVPGATVTVVQQETGNAQTVTTKDDGSYTVTQLTPGRYELRVEAANFKRGVQTDLVLETDQTQRVNVTLEAGSVSETVTVISAAPVINTDTSDKGEVITNRQVQELPLNGRDATDLAQLVPGVYQRPAEDDQGQGLAVAGTRTDSTNFILDGVNNRSDRNGGIGVNTSVDSIREFKVSTSTYSAEFGRTAGAQINVVSKSGTNDYNGSL
ncbi:MAG: carboxypeptidase regulatory-like domain-containing protein, partial [Pyrinomonadaceae bacterium]